MAYGTSSVSFLVIGSSKRRPIRRLTANTVLSGLVTAWRLAGWPISRSPSLANATIDGVVRAPSAFSITLGLPPSITATQLLVVPRSIPITFAIGPLWPLNQKTNPARTPLERRCERLSERDIGGLSLAARIRWPYGFGDFPEAGQRG